MSLNLIMKKVQTNWLIFPEKPARITICF